MASMPIHDSGRGADPLPENETLEPSEYKDFNDAALDAFVAEVTSEFEAAGMSVLVVNGKDTFAKAYGYADVENKIPVTPETLFFTGSTTKSFTATIAAHLVESPEHPDFTWKTPLSQIIGDDFVLASGSSLGDWATKHATIEDALSHRTGMPRHDTVRSNGDPSIRDSVRALRHLPMRGELRAGYWYTNLMYTAVVHAIETTLNRSFDDLLSEQIFIPLEMNATSYSLDTAREVSEQQKIPLARGYLWATSGYFHPVPFESIGPGGGSGGINSNVLDYGRWVRHLMKATERNHALSTNAVKALRTPRVLRTFDPYGPLGAETYGLGLNIGVYRNRPIFYHGGAAGGYMTTMLMVPSRPGASTSSKQDPDATERADSDIAIVVMQNTDGPAHRIVAWHLLDKFMQTPENERRDLITAARNNREKKIEEMQPANILKNLFGTAQLAEILPPALPLSSYEGVYHHVAYHDYRVSLTKPVRGERMNNESSKQIAEAESANESPDTGSSKLLYYTSGSPVSYLDFAATLHHVSGEWWYQHRSVFVNCVLSDSARKLQFVIGPTGTVVGLKTLVEKAIGDELTYFEKIS